jgi:AraC-like DNA-binding protein
MPVITVAAVSFGILQCVLVAVALIRKKSNHPSTIYLILFLAVVALQLTLKLISKGWLWENVRTFYMISYNYGYLIGPAIFLFIRSQQSRRPFKWSYLSHLVPFAIATSLTVADEVFGIIYEPPFRWLFPWPSLQIISILFYTMAAWRLTKPEHQSIRRFLVITFVTESMVMMTIRFLVSNLSMAPDLRFVFMFLTALIYWITYKLIASPDTFSMRHDIPVIQMIAGPTIKYANSGLRAEQTQRIMSDLRQLIDKEQLFLQPEITIDQVAERLKISKHHLSQIVNQDLGHTFNNLVYNWRLNEAQKRLLDPKFRDLKIAAIAYDLGFSSVSVFTRMFKKRFGVTPSALRDGPAEIQKAANSRFF